MHTGGGTNKRKQPNGITNFTMTFLSFWILMEIMVIWIEIQNYLIIKSVTQCELNHFTYLFIQEMIFSPDNGTKLRIYSPVSVF